MRQDRLSLLAQDGLEEQTALSVEFEHGRHSLAQAGEGVERFRGGAGRGGAFGS
jgi:enoyl-CoA hydratase